jgi:hypothetical protein
MRAQSLLAVLALTLALAGRAWAREPVRVSSVMPNELPGGYHKVEFMGGNAKERSAASARFLTKARAIAYSTQVPNKDMHRVNLHWTGDMEALHTLARDAAKYVNSQRLGARVRQWRNQPTMYRSLGLPGVLTH